LGMRNSAEAQQRSGDQWFQGGLGKQFI
jgi:hypothetical protein